MSVSALDQWFLTSRSLTLHADAGLSNWIRAGGTWLGMCLPIYIVRIVRIARCDSAFGDVLFDLTSDDVLPSLHSGLRAGD